MYPLSSTEDFIADHAARHSNEKLLDSIEGAARRLSTMTRGDATPVETIGDDAPGCTHRLVRESGFVFNLHPCHIQLTMQISLFTGQFEVSTHAGIEHVLKLLTAYAHQLQYNPILAVLPSVSPLPEDAYDNQLRLDLNPNTGLAAIACTLERGPRPGMWFTRDNTTSLTEPYGLVWDYHNGDETPFPTDAAVPIDTMIRAVHEFYDLNGADLPSCVDWQAAPEVRW
jgi:hypothetical protein